MPNWFTNIYTQGIVILRLNSVLPESSPPQSSEYQVPQSSEEQIFRMPVLSTGIIAQTGLSQEYLELGEVLNEMVELEEDNEWRIEEPVYTNARRVAAELMAGPYPAPRVFNHGPKSVVFNWESGTKNLYLTISSNRISGLLSSPERIERQIDCPINQLPNTALLLAYIQPDHWGQPFTLVETVSDPSEHLDPFLNLIST